MSNARILTQNWIDTVGSFQGVIRTTEKKNNCQFEQAKISARGKAEEEF